ncbi:hypothetical protein [Thalassolituus sp. C2-1]|uniref:hypothetical protein n=1 Tax=Venatorbacter sp. C2-1 TaxID=2597518 RepID=UPI0011966B1D|nr:hypothetical protein [Thalassolituus sp. C2-1]TVV45412.1 hypothetical protein FOT50_00820 [Thalassolituus sp. C2-1]
MMDLAVVVFFVEVIALSLYIRRVNDLTYRETFLVATGFLRCKRNWKINVGNFLVFVIPSAIIFYEIESRKF